MEARVWCERGDLNPHGFLRQILSLVRLPISPLSQWSSHQRLYRDRRGMLRQLVCRGLQREEISAAARCGLLFSPGAKNEWVAVPTGMVWLSTLSVVCPRAVVCSPPQPLRKDLSCACLLLSPVALDLSALFS